MVYALKADGMLVINLDKMRPNLREFFKYNNIVRHRGA